MIAIRLLLATAAFLLSTSASAGAMLVWSEFNGKLHTANTDGSGYTTLPTVTAGGVAVDPATGRVYYSDYGAIHSARLDGSDQRLVATTGSSIVWNMVIAKGKLYFNSSGIDDAAGIGRVNLDGTGLTRIADRASGEAIAYDADADKIIYQHFGTSDEPGVAVKSVNADGSRPAAMLAAQPTLGFVPGLYVDNVFDQLYFTNGSAIYRSNLDGSNLTFIAAPVEGYMYSLVVDALNNTIYYGSRVDGVIGRMDLDGANQRTLVQAGDGFYALSLYNAAAPPAVPVDMPEPGTPALCALALAGLAAARRRKA